MSRSDSSAALSSPCPSRRARPRPASLRHSAWRSRRPRGFTLLELIIVVAIIGILATIAMPALKDMPRRAAEVVLKINLHTLRGVIDQYYGDRGYYPASLDALVEDEYLRGIPYDPITKSDETWVVVYEELDPEAPPAESELPEDGQPGVIDVYSGSEEVSLDGTPYDEW